MTRKEAINMNNSYLKILLTMKILVSKAKPKQETTRNQWTIEGSQRERTNHAHAFSWV